VLDFKHKIVYTNSIRSKMKKTVIKKANAVDRKTKFYTFSQNNSGGSFDYDEKRGIGEVVIVESTSYQEANGIAERIGLYFDGVDGGQDCECCGDRWTSVWDESYGADVPSYYSTPLSKLEDSWFDKRIFVHNLDGSIVKYEIKKKR
jgi:hypothetical protein